MTTRGRSTSWSPTCSSPTARAPTSPTRSATFRPGITTVFVCGYTADALAERGVRADGLEMLAKPYNGVELAARVRRILDAQPRTEEPRPAA